MTRQLCYGHHIIEFNALSNSRRYEASSWVTVAKENCAECKRLAAELDTWESFGRGYVDFPEPSQTYGADDA